MLVAYGRCQQLTTSQTQCKGHTRTTTTGVSGLYWVKVTVCKCGRTIEHNLPPLETKTKRAYVKRPKTTHKIELT
jgi:hypothetical protein